MRARKKALEMIIFLTRTQSTFTENIVCDLVKDEDEKTTNDVHKGLLTKMYTFQVKNYVPCGQGCSVNQITVQLHL